MDIKVMSARYAFFLACFQQTGNWLEWVSEVAGLELGTVLWTVWSGVFIVRIGVNLLFDRPAKYREIRVFQVGRMDEAKPQGVGMNDLAGYCFLDRGLMLLGVRGNLTSTSRSRLVLHQLVDIKIIIELAGI